MRTRSALARMPLAAGLLFVALPVFARHVFFDTQWRVQKLILRPPAAKTSAGQ